MPPKGQSQLPALPPYARALLEKPELLLRTLNLLASGLFGRTITDHDLAGSLALQEYGTTYTIATGAITLTTGSGQNTASPSSILVAAESGTTDTLSTISGGREGMVLFLRADVGDTITLDELGNLSLGGEDIVLSGEAFVMLKYNEALTAWLYAVSRTTDHDHTGDPGDGGTVSHDALDDVSVDDHHAEDHDHDGIPTQKLAQANTHESADTDVDPTSIHHTLGTGANQSSAGDHTHAGSSAHTIEEDGTPLTARTGLNFVAGLVASDDAGDDETDVNLDYATTEIVDVAAAEGAGTSDKIPRADHVHAHGSGYLPNAHHAQAHGASDHTNRTRRLWLPAHLFAPHSPTMVAATTVISIVGSVASIYDKIAVWPFDPTDSEDIGTTLLLPSSWDGGAITPTIYWAPSTTDTGTVQWQLLGTMLAAADQVDEVFGASYSSTPAAIAASGTAEAMQVTAMPALTPTSDLWRFAIHRAPAFDTFTGDAWFVGLLIEYPADM